jgi:isoquinoline 1-oxidoreductase beta subunit
VPLYIGGGFGRKVGIDAPVEAARLARAAGRPVYVGWTRTEDLRYGYRRPPAHNLLNASIDENGNILALQHRIVSSDIIFNSDVGLPGFVGNILGADFLATYGSQILYSIPNRRVDYHHRSLPVPTAYWRGLGSFPNTFAMETFMDEVAAAAGVDPLQLRLNHLPEGELGERFRAALEAVAEASNWSEAPAEGRGRGIVSAYDRGTVVALVIEASVEDERIRLHHAWCAVDPGLVVNPDGAAAQVQGSIIMALSSALYEKQELADGMITAENFNNYPLITMRDAPTIDVIPLNSSNEPVGGLGEPVVGCVPAALSNAVFAASGTRLRDMPFRLA